MLILNKVPELLRHWKKEIQTHLQQKTKLLYQCRWVYPKAILQNDLAPELDAQGLFQLNLDCSMIYSMMDFFGIFQKRPFR